LHAVGRKFDLKPVGCRRLGNTKHYISRISSQT
jgi:hypothetical protein